MKKTIICIIGFAALLIGCAGPTTQDYPQSMSFDVFVGGQNAGMPDLEDPEQGPREVVIQDQETLEEEWAFIHLGTDPVPQMPEVDFSEQMILGVYQGVQGTGGFSIVILDVLEYADRIEVFVQETIPGPDDMVTQALTHPYYFVSVDSSDKEVVFVRE